MSHTSEAKTNSFLAAKSGDSDALGALLETYRSYLKIIARAQQNTAKSPRNSVDPSDLVQDVIWEAFRGFDGFRGQTPAQLLVWLRQILSRNLVDQHRFRRAAKRDDCREVSLNDAFTESSHEVLAALQSPVSSPSARLSAEEQSIGLANALERLPADYRDVIIGRNFKRQAFSELASASNRSTGAMRMLYGRAIDRLRAELKEMGR